MTGPAWLVTVLLIAAATAVAWPVRAARTRRRAVLGAPSRPGVCPAPDEPRTRSGASAGHRATLPRGRRGEECTVERPLPTRPPNRRDSAHPSAILRTADPGHSPATRLFPPPPGGPTPRRSAGSRHDGLATMPPRGDRLDGDRPSPGPFFRDAPVTDLAAGLPRTVPAAGSAHWRAVHLPPRRALLAAVLVGGGAGAVLGGPVGAVALAAYGALGARAVRRRHVRRSADRVRRAELDQLCALAADLRAGLPATLALVDGPDRVARLALAAARLADRTGAPLAELLERVEADARATDRGLAAAAAQAAGARATAWLLAVLPLGGIGLGYAIGVDPVEVLLHTPVGGGSALGALGLQIGGLLWAERLGAFPGGGD